ncbi:MAG: hypothetical protein HS130_07780 [Deltaproteobacteria bacterium]|nr:hypothetical protein [Deltaproteobacteria bacterium]MCL4873090.1 hypothetical protein [bacterium]
MDEALTEVHKKAAYRFRGFANTPDPDARRFVCPATGVGITDAMCEKSRKAAPEVCINCLIPLAGKLCAGTPCEKCGRLFSAQEARAGFITCEFCG